MFVTNSNSSPNSPARVAGLYRITFSPLHLVGPHCVGPSSVKDRRHDHMAVPSHRVAHRLHVPTTLFWLREEMKHRPVMPHIIGVTWELDRHDVSLDSGNRSGTRAKALPREFKCSSNDVKYCHVLIALCERSIHEAGCPPRPHR